MKWFRREKRTPEAIEWKRVSEKVRAAKQLRYEQTITKRDLVDAVSAVLFVEDPVGINFEENTDEYDAEAETIVIALPRTSSPDDVRALVHEVFVHWFGAESAGPIDRYTTVGQQIWSLWHRN